MILETLVAHAAAAGYEQRVVVGIPDGQETPSVGGLAAESVLPVRFETGALDFPVLGMSDVMPYRSTVWSSMSDAQLERYRAAWRAHLTAVVEEFQPDLIHAHHIWLMSSMLGDIAPDLPIVLQCHGTGLRQMELCPGLAAEVRRGCARADRFQVLRDDHADLLVRELGVARERVHVIPAGFNERIFHGDDRTENADRGITYVGKYSAAKGLPELLDAVEQIEAEERAPVELHVAGDGSGAEAEALRRRMAAMDLVTMHGQLDQPALAELLRRSSVCVLPSYYEGVPLVLVEAAACGCKIVATALAGVVEQLAPRLGRRLTMVEMPNMIGIDTPDPNALPAFRERLAAALITTLDGPVAPADLRPFDWAGVFDRVESVWSSLLGKAAPA